MSERLCNVLFLCTHNSARSVMAEALLNTLGHGRFKAFSAGSAPSGRVNPFAIEMADAIGYPTDRVRSKSWDEFAEGQSGTTAPAMDIVITVCDNAAVETCPVWAAPHGTAPATAHWGFPDPSTEPGTDADKRRAFERVFLAIRADIARLVALPVESLDRVVLARELARIHAP